MDILGIGFPELVFIFMIALMIFGPRRLPEIAGKAGKMVRDLRNMSQGFLAEWQREITVAARLEEIEEVRRELDETKKALQQTQKDITTSTTTQLDETKKTLQQAQKDIATTPSTQLDETKKTLQQAQKDLTSENSVQTDKNNKPPVPPLTPAPPTISPTEVLNE